MDHYFRFLMNVDQCLNPSVFDMFFYRLEKQGDFHSNEVQLLGDGVETSLHSAVLDVRMYLDKFPFRVNDFQIVFAMRLPYQAKLTSWRDTLLYRLVWIWHELKQSHIYIGARERLETMGSHALSIITLYDADFNTEIPALVSYRDELMRSHASQMLREEFGLDEEQCDAMSFGQFCDALRKGLENPSVANPALRTLVETFLAKREQSGADDLSRNLEHFLHFLLEEMREFQIEENLIDQNNRRNNMMALLRVVEFIAPTVEVTPENNLNQFCRTWWAQVWADDTLENRYSAMLRRYQERLRTADPTRVKDQDSGDVPRLSEFLHIHRDAQGREYVDYDIRSAEYPEFQKSRTERRRTVEDTDIHSVLDGFLKTLRRKGGQEVISAWNSAYTDMKRHLDKLQRDLQMFGAELSVQYDSKLTQRRQDSAWNQIRVMEDPDGQTVKERMKAADELETRFALLKQPHMNPSLSQQDRLNVSNELEQANLDILFNMRCLSRARMLPFILLVLLTGGFAALHYGLMQPYVFTDGVYLAVYLGYTLCSLVLMLLGWTAPRRHFRGNIRERVLRLQEAMDTFIAGYYDKGYHFYVYINTLNEIDIITRFLRLTDEIEEERRTRASRRQWHKEQLARHLNKVSFFQELIDLLLQDDRVDSRGMTILNKDWNGDTVHSRVYWPQE